MVDLRLWNSTNVLKLIISLNVRTIFLYVITKQLKAFADPSKILPLKTNVVATIPTEDKEPIYFK